jgi:hypothetical protein
MPSNPLGASFAPTNDNAQMAGKSAATAPSFSRPIQTLNFRLPKVTNAPSPLLSQQQAGSGIGQAVLQSVLKTVLGVDAASQLAQPSSAPSGYGQPSRDEGQSALQQFLSPAPTQSRPTMPSPSPQPTAPMFEGNFDTPPEQNGPPQFGAQAPAQADAGGGLPSAWDILTMSDDDPLKQNYLQMLRDSGFGNNGPGTRAPNPTFIVDTNPGAGAGRA